MRFKGKEDMVGYAKRSTSSYEPQASHATGRHSASRVCAGMVRCELCGQAQWKPRLFSRHEGHQYSLAGAKGCFARSRVESCFVRFRRRNHRRTNGIHFGVSVPAFDWLCDGRWIVASRRSPVGRPNAKLLSTDGRQFRQFCLGDGIKHLQADTISTLWVGYSDEGIYGAPLSAAVNQAISQGSPPGQRLVIQEGVADGQFTDGAAVLKVLAVKNIAARLNSSRDDQRAVK